MKVEQRPYVFPPVEITLESPEELTMMLWYLHTLRNHPDTSTQYALFGDELVHQLKKVVKT